MPSPDELLGTVESGSPDAFAASGAALPRGASPNAALQEILGQPTTGEPSLDILLGMVSPETLKRAALPAVGGAAGLALGGPIGGVAGSIGGEALTQLVDPLRTGAQPNILELILSGVPIPSTTAMRRGLLSLPGAAAGLQEFLLERVGRAGGRIGGRIIEKLAPPPGTASALFEQANREAGKAGVKIVPVALAEAVEDLTKQAAKGEVRVPGLRRLLEDTGKIPARGTVDFDAFRADMSRVGAKVRRLERERGETLGAAKTLYAAMWTDVDALAAKGSGPVVATLRDAIDAFKREEAAEFFSTYFQSTRSVGQQVLNVDQVMARIDKNRAMLARLIPDAEINGVLQALEPLAKIPVPQKTAQVGFSQGFSRGELMVGKAGVAAGAGAFVGGATGATIGAGTVIAIEAISTALTTKPGRQVIKLLAENGATINQIGNALLQTGRAAVMNEPLEIGPVKIR